MPTVPTYSGRNVPRGSGPGLIGVNAPSAPSDAFGTSIRIRNRPRLARPPRIPPRDTSPGTGAIFSGIIGLGRTAVDIGQQIQQRNDRMALSEWDNHVTGVGIAAHNPDGGIFSRRGADAQGVFEEASQSIARLHEEMKNRLPDHLHGQGLAALDRVRASLLPAAARHQFQEMANYENEIVKRGIDLSIANLATAPADADGNFNPADVIAARDTITRNVGISFDNRLGDGWRDKPEAAKLAENAVRNYLSRAVVGKAEFYLAEGNARAALTLIEKNRADISSEDYAKFVPALRRRVETETANARGNALSSSGIDVGEAMKRLDTEFKDNPRQLETAQQAFMRNARIKWAGEERAKKRLIDGASAKIVTGEPLTVDEQRGLGSDLPLFMRRQNDAQQMLAHRPTSDPGALQRFNSLSDFEVSKMTANEFEKNFLDMFNAEDHAKALARRRGAVQHGIRADLEEKLGQDPPHDLTGEERYILGQQGTATWKRQDRELRARRAEAARQGRLLSGAFPRTSDPVVYRAMRDNFDALKSPEELKLYITRGGQIQLSKRDYVTALNALTDATQRRELFARSDLDPKVARDADRFARQLVDEQGTAIASWSSSTQKDYNRIVEEVLTDFVAYQEEIGHPASDAERFEFFKRRNRAVVFDPGWFSSTPVRLADIVRGDRSLADVKMPEADASVVRFVEGAVGEDGAREVNMRRASALFRLSEYDAFSDSQRVAVQDARRAFAVETGVWARHWGRPPSLPGVDVTVTPLAGVR